MLKNIIKYLLNNKFFQIILNVIFILINILLLVFLFIGLPEKDIKEIENNNFKKLLYSYKYIESLYQITLILYGSYSLYRIYYLEENINDILFIIFLFLTIILIILKSIVIFIIHRKYKNSKYISKNLKLNILFSLIINCILFSVMIIIIIFQIFYYQENDKFFDTNAFIRLLQYFIKKN